MLTPMQVPSHMCTSHVLTPSLTYVCSCAHCHSDMHTHTLPPPPPTPLVGTLCPWPPCPEPCPPTSVTGDASSVRTSRCPRVQMSQPLRLPHPARANIAVGRMGSCPSTPPIYPQLFPAVGDLMLQPLWESRDRYEELKRKDDATTAVSWGRAHLTPGRG